MANFCLVPQLAEKFLQKVKSGEINPDKLVDMTSKERRDFFAEFLGDSNAQHVNTQFESKMLLKDQQQGIINWVKSTTGLKPEVQRDILAKVNRMTEVLQPKDLDHFLSDLAEQRLGFGVTMEEAGKIADLAKKVNETKAAMDNGGDRMDYGKAKVDFGKYVSDLKHQASKMTLDKFKQNPGTAIKEGVLDTAGLTKSLKASLDNSAIFRQGWKTLFTHPTIWMKNAAQSFSDIVGTIGGKEVADAVKADILSRKNYDLYQKAKLATSTVEEDFPTQLQEKIWGVGKLFKASEVAYTSFLHRMRADVFDKYVEIANKSGVELDKTQLESMGKLVNSLTGRGNLGKLEPSAQIVNNIFFSPRKLKADFDFLTAHTFQKDVTPFVRKQAAINLTKVIAGTVTILAIAEAISPGSVEKDPRSSDFGKIKIGDTRFDVTGGMASILTLSAREFTQSTKSTSTKKVSPLNARDKKGNLVFGGQSGVDVFTNFVEGKLSPAVSVVKDLMKGQDYNGNKPTVKNEANNLGTPLPITTYLELKNNPNSANRFLSMLADALGISVNTYAPPKKKKK